MSDFNSSLHVRLVRKVSRHVIFKVHPDYRDFTHILNEACQREPVRILGSCLLPNSVYLLLASAEEASIARLLQWVFATHAKRYHAKHDTDGTLWRGRALSVPVQANDSIFAVQQALLRLPSQRRLIGPRERWPWIIIGPASSRTIPFGEPCQAQLRYVEHCLDAGLPIGEADWLASAGLLPENPSPPKRRGRPPKPKAPALEFIATDSQSA